MSGRGRKPGTKFPGVGGRPRADHPVSEGHKALQVRLSPDLWEKLAELAASRGLEPVTWVRTIIEESTNRAHEA